MRRLIWFLLVIFGLGFTAVSCNAATEEASTPAPAEDEGGALNAAPENGDEGQPEAPIAEPDVFPRVTLTPPPVGQPESAPEAAEGYPVAPTPSPLPEGYELPPTAPALDPYPEASGTLVWITKPVGEQCADPPATPDLQTAVADMIAFGIPVEGSEMTELEVCTACGCPTSAHFRLQIDSGYLANAAMLGWEVEQ